MKSDIPYGLPYATVEKIVSLFKKYPQIEKAIIYGSRAKGTYRKGSDIDIVLIGPTLTHHDLVAIEDKIDDLFLPYSFDLSLFKSISSEELIDHINRIGLTFYEKKQPSA